MSSFPTEEELLEFSPGVILGIWKDDKPVYVKALGDANIFTGTPMKKDLHIRIGSVTKCYTATVVLYLARKGLIDLEKTAHYYFSRSELRKQGWFEYLPKDVTVGQLGNMTSGLYNYSESEEFLRRITRNPEEEFSANGLLSKYALNSCTENYFEPGKGWYYSNTNYLLLGLLAEVTSGKSIKELYKKIIFKPLNLEETSVAEFTEIPYPYANGYTYGYNDPKKKPFDVLRQVTHENPSWTNTAGYMISTIEDTRVFIKSYVTGTIIGKEMKEYRKTTFVNLINKKYGFGMLKIDDWCGHNGEIPGYQTVALHNSDLNITLVVMTNLDRNVVGLEVADVIAKKIIAYYDGKKC